MRLFDDTAEQLGPGTSPSDPGSFEAEAEEVFAGAEQRERLATRSVHLTKMSSEPRREHKKGLTLQDISSYNSGDERFPAMDDHEMASDSHSFYGDDDMNERSTKPYPGMEGHPRFNGEDTRTFYDGQNGDESPTQPEIQAPCVFSDLDNGDVSVRVCDIYSCIAYHDAPSQASAPGPRTPACPRSKSSNLDWGQAQLLRRSAQLRPGG
jgi:hypothetical protein